ncbi:MAG: hypothetical protein WDM79_00590 [Terricaulis sp.]
MTHGKLIVITPDVEVNADITASAELAALSERFVAEATALAEACSENISITANMRFREAAGGEVVHHGKKAARNGVLHALRPFVLNDERLYVPTYLNAFSRENREQPAIGAAKFMRNAFLLRHAPFQLTTARGELELEQQWQYYVNAYEYHRDDKKRAAVDAAFRPMPPMAEFAFWWGVSVKVNTILSMRGFASVLCGLAPAFTLNLRDEPPA